MRCHGLLLLAAACGAAQEPQAPRCPGDDVTVQTDEEARALAPCTAIEGSLAIGPSMALTSLAGLERITRVSGALTVRGNLVLTGAYFPALAAVGAIVIEDNRLLETASLHHVRRVREVIVRRNRALERLDLGALDGGAVELDDNPRLDMIDLGRARERPLRDDAAALPR